MRMLQALMRDPLTGSDQPFMDMLKDYYHQYRGKRANTMDFQRTVSGHMGKDMSWFFDQWIYGTDIPVYEYGYTVKEQTPGRFLLTLRVRQENVEENFRMPVPVEIRFENEDLTPVRDTILVQGDVSEKRFSLQAEPGELIFNVDDVVLSEWDETDYEDIVPQR